MTLAALFTKKAGPRHHTPRLSGLIAVKRSLDTATEAADCQGRVCNFATTRVENLKHLPARRSIALSPAFACWCRHLTALRLPRGRAYRLPFGQAACRAPLACMCHTSAACTAAPLSQQGCLNQAPVKLCAAAGRIRGLGHTRNEPFCSSRLNNRLALLRSHLLMSAVRQHRRRRRRRTSQVRFRLFQLPLGFRGRYPSGAKAPPGKGSQAPPPGGASGARGVECSNMPMAHAHGPCPGGMGSRRRCSRQR